MADDKKPYEIRCEEITNDEFPDFWDSVETNMVEPNASEAEKNGLKGVMKMVFYYGVASGYLEAQMGLLRESDRAVLVALAKQHKIDLEEEQ